MKTTTKKIFALVAVVAVIAAMAVGFAACDNNPENVITVGYTLYEPMNYMDANNKLIGFDTDLAKAVFKELGYEVVFKEIKWDNKYLDLNSGTVNCLWNGFTSNGEDDGTPRDQLVDFSYKYMINKQCVVVNTTGAAKDAASIEDLNQSGITGVYENSSAGQEFADTNMPLSTRKGAESQMKALTEVNSDSSSYAVVDYLLAIRLAGKEGFANLKIVDSIEANEEQYAIGFKKGDPLRDKVNQVLQKFLDDGTILEIAQKYDLEDALITDYAQYEK